MNNNISAWGRSIRRVLCCGPGAENGDEPVYESLRHQTEDGDADSSMRELVDEIRWLLAPIAEVQERMRWVELCLHPLLVYRPEEETQYVNMLNGLQLAPAAPPPEPPTPSIWLAWLQERVDYGEPW